MATHDYNIANQTGADFRADLNNALLAIVSNNSNASAPSTTFAYQLWVDTANNVLKLRNSANNAWITTGISITASNSFTGDITGNSATATALATARTINGVSFDGTANISFNTDSVSEGSSNLYFTNERVDDQVNSLLTAGSGISLTYDDAAGTLTIANTNSADITSVVAGDGLTGGGTSGDVTLAVGVDDSSIEINSDALRVKASGVTNAMLAGSIANDKLAGSIANSKLANSSVTINSQAISLGGSHTFDSDDIGEGSSNLYFTNARARGSLSIGSEGSASGNGAIAYNSSTGVFTYTPPVISGLTGDTDDLSEGSSNLYYTDARANAAIDARVTNTFINNLSGVVADTATALAAARSIALSGDVTASGVNFDGTGDITLSTTIAANSVALGTDTTGNYVATVADAGNSRITVANSGSETAAVTLDIADDAIGTDQLANNAVALGTQSTGNYVATVAGTTNEIEVSGSGSETASVTIGLPDNVTIAGNLTVNGTTTSVNTQTLEVEDPLIKLAKDNSGADSVDIGFYGLYDTSGSQDLYAGLFRDASDSGKFKLFKDLQAEPTTTVNTSGTGYAVGTLVSNLEGDVTGNVTGNVSGTAATVTGAAQTNITSLGTLTALTVTGEITANGGIALGDSDKATFGVGDDLEIYHDGSHSYIKDGGTGNLLVQATHLVLENAAGDKNYLQGVDGDAVSIYYNGSTKLATTSSGVDVTGTLTATTLAGTLSTAAQTNITSVGTLSSLDVGTITSTGNLVLNQDSGTIFIGADLDMRILHDGSNGTFRNDTGNLTIDVGGDIILDAGGDDITFKSGGTEFGSIFKVSNDLFLNSAISDGDIKFRGNDGGSFITALTLDMSDAGAATFNSNITFGDGHTIGDDADDNLAIASSANENIIIDSSDDIILDAGGGDWKFKDDGVDIGLIANSSSDLIIQSIVSDKDMLFRGNDGGSTIVALTLDMSNAGAATFNNNVTCNRVSTTDGIIDTGQAGSSTVFNEDGTTADFRVESTSNTHMLFVDGGLDRVGINTASPSSKLTVAGDIEQTTGDLKYTGGINWDIAHHGASQNIVFSTTPSGGSATERMRIRHDGRVGIGTASPQAHLDINTETAEATNVILNGEANQDKILKFRHYGNSEAAGDGFAGFIGSVVDNVLTLGHYNSSNTEVQALHINESGNCGLGTSSPNFTLQLDSNRADATFDADDVSTWADFKIQADTASGNARGIYFDFDSDTGNDKGAGIVGISGDATGGVGSLGFITTTGNVSAERMRIDSSGNLGLGSASPEEKLHVAGNVLLDDADPRLYFQTGSSHYNWKIAAQDSTNKGFEISSGEVDGDANSDTYTPRIVIEADTGHVGLGTSNPSSILHCVVSGADAKIQVETDGGNDAILELTAPAASGAQSKLMFSDDGASGVGSIVYAHNSGGTDYMTFGTASTERMRIDSSGSLILGTTTVASANAAADDFVIKGSGTAVGMTISQDSDSGTGTIFFGDTSSSSAAGFRYNHNTGDMAISAEDNVTFSCDAVGIGTTSPTGKLEIAATGTNAAPHIKLVESGDAREFNIYNDGSGNGHLVLADSDDDTPDTEIVLNDNGIITMLTGNSERMRIDSSGNVLFGKTAASTSGQGVYIEPSNIGYGRANFVSQSTSGVPLAFYYDNGSSSTQVGFISTTASATAYNTSSDARLKDVTGSSRGLDVINNLNPVAYNWKADGKADEGLIAQEVEELVPNAVNQNEDGYYQMDYSKLVTHLVKGMQEQQEQIESLKSEIANLKGE